MENYKAIPAQVLKNKKSCCKSGCLHCPYGYTLKKFGLQFEDLKENYTLPSGLEDFKIDLEQYELKDYKFILLKEHTCGIMRKDKLFVREIKLLPDFNDQGLDKALIESYYFY